MWPMLLTSFAMVLTKFNASDLIQKRSVFELTQIVFFRSGSSIYIVAGIRLSNEDRAVRRDGQTVQQRPQRIDSSDKLIRLDAEDEQVAVRRW